MATLSSSAKNAFLHGKWSSEDSARLYGLADWGKGYFGVNDTGHLTVMPAKDPGRQIDLYEVIEGLRERDIHTPVLVRFSGILSHRLHEIRSAFDKAILEHEYKGQYSCVYPIKVNQQRHVCEEVRNLGAKLGFGLEAGSKPELLAVLGLTDGLDTMPIVCNGFKDDEFIEMVILAAKLGRNIIPVVEKFSELELIVKHAQKYGVRPRIGIRVKLSSRGAGRWESSAGVRSKFGLFVSEVLEAVEYLKARGMLDCLEMLHCHVGSQLYDIRYMKNAVNELAHVYTELRRLGAGMNTIDIGGGMGVDYDGSQSAWDSSINYSVEEYASDVVYRIKTVCDDAECPHPTIFSESGRAMVAYHSVLVVDVLGMSRFSSAPGIEKIKEEMKSEQEPPQPVMDLIDAYERLGDRNIVEVYHDAVQARDEAMSLFSLGYMSLPMRAASERLFWALAQRIAEKFNKKAGGGGEIPEEFESLPDLLSDIYFCNFSLFQSMPDSWAIDQLFPICPIHRLNEEPTRRAILADITCDSDGKIDHFVDKRIEKKTLELHELRDASPGGNGNGGANAGVPSASTAIGAGSAGASPAGASPAASPANPTNGGPGGVGGGGNGMGASHSSALHSANSNIGANGSNGNGAGGGGGHEQYFLGIFLLGAYQEILGDLHNLLGDTHAVHVSVDESGEWYIEEIVEGDTVKEVLGYVQFDADDMQRAMRKSIEGAVRAKRLTVVEGQSLLNFYEAGLGGYTYLEE